MPVDQGKSDRTKAILVILVILVLIAAAIFFGANFLKEKTPDRVVEATSEAVPDKAVRKKIGKPTTIDYEKDRDLIAKRKAELGFDKGVDMIVRPGETIRVGDALVSVDEVLDKIRLKTGAINEQDIGNRPEAKTLRRVVKLPEALEKVKKLDEEYQELERQLASPEKLTGPEVEQKLRKRKNAITPIVNTYRRYQAILEKQKAIQKQLETANGNDATALGQELETLDKERAELEKAILTHFSPDQDLDAYGIYMVKPKDNIWNIHFQFLKDYFNHKGIALSPMADEPASKGKSSGVGRLLKFSEAMVYIYNVREKRLDTDLHLIHPLSKIVVFNLAKVFAMLESIDYSDVSRIRFDGETLWLPAKEK